MTMVINVCIIIITIMIVTITTIAIFVALRTLSILKKLDHASSTLSSGAASMQHAASMVTSFAQRLNNPGLKFGLGLASVLIPLILKFRVSKKCQTTNTDSPVQ